MTVALPLPKDEATEGSWYVYTEASGNSQKAGITKTGSAVDQLLGVQGSQVFLRNATAGICSGQPGVRRFNVDPTPALLLSHVWLQHGQPPT